MLNFLYKFYSFLFIFFKSINFLKEKKIVVLICSYNNEKFCVKNILSVLNQKYNNFRIIYVNDFSKDRTSEIIKSFVNYRKNIQFTLINNNYRKGNLRNKYEIINKYCLNNEIVVVLDGDDYLFCSYVLSYINYIYCKYKIWITFGNYIHASGKRSSQRGYSHEIIHNNRFRESHHPSHLRTFYAKLFKKINKTYFLDKNKKFFTTGEDKASMIPMIELAGKKHYFINHILYVYNDNNPIGLYKNYSIHDIKKKNRIQILSKKKLNPLNEI